MSPPQTPISQPAGIDVFVLTRFSILSEKQRHSWGIFESRLQTQVRKLLKRPKTPPTIAEKRAYLFDPERLKYRLFTFETFTLKSLANQVDQNFRHLVCTSDELPPETRAGLDALATRYRFEIIEVDRKTLFTKKLAALPEFNNLQTDYVATMRLDDDDAIGRNAIGTIRALVPCQHTDFVLSWPKGLFLTDVGDRRYQTRRSNKPSLTCGMTRIRKGTSIHPTVHGTGNHKYVADSFPFLTLPDEDAYLMTNHADNISRRSRRDPGRPLTGDTRDLPKREFGVTL
ncbi:MAG: glycosyltransferase [Pseudomonadota bacterium]